MPKTIQQSVTLPASAAALFDMYLDPAEHAALTGAPVIIGAAPGAEFHAFNGMLSGRILHVVPKRLVAQLWRSAHFGPEDLDSILVLTFSSAGRHGRIDLVHVNVADQDYDGVNEGWEKYYWTPWRQYLGRRRVR
jgi:activator of HSP90 ATPase